MIFSDTPKVSHIEKFQQNLPVTQNILQHNSKPILSPNMRHLDAPFSWNSIDRSTVSRGCYFSCIFRVMLFNQQENHAFGRVLFHTSEIKNCCCTNGQNDTKLNELCRVQTNASPMTLSANHISVFGISANQSLNSKHQIKNQHKWSSFKAFFCKYM